MAAPPGPVSWDRSPATTSVPWQCIPVTARSCWRRRRLDLGGWPTAASPAAEALQFADSRVMLGKVPAISIFFDPNDGNVAWASMGSLFGNARNGVYRSTDAGRTWAPVTGSGSLSLPSTDVGRIEFTMAPSDSSTLYAQIQDDRPPTSAACSASGRLPTPAIPGPASLRQPRIGEPSHGSRIPSACRRRIRMLYGAARCRFTAAWTAALPGRRWRNRAATAPAFTWIFTHWHSRRTAAVSTWPTTAGCTALPTSARSG